MVQNKRRGAIIVCTNRHSNAQHTHIYKYTHTTHTHKHVNKPYAHTLANTLSANGLTNTLPFFVVMLVRLSRCVPTSSTRGLSIFSLSAQRAWMSCSHSMGLLMSWKLRRKTTIKTEPSGYRNSSWMVRY